MKHLAVCAIAAILASPASAQRAGLRDHDRIREAVSLLEIWVDAQRAYEGIPGISMAVVHDQELLWAKGFGFADRERRAPATPETIYSICSISKLFTALAVMQLRDAGALRLDDPVGKHLAWFDLRDKYPAAPPITVQGILTHSSGVPRESAHPYWSPPDFPFPTRDEIIDKLGQQEELYPAFEYFQYSNLGLTLAGEIVAAASGKSYADYVQARIITPLGLSATTPTIPVREHGRRMAKGYAARNRDGERAPVPIFDARGIGPAAGYASTVLDLARFASWQFRVLHEDANEVLRRNTLREMYRVHWMDPDWETTWGLGFAVWRSDDKTFVGHGGSCPGYRSHLSVLPSDKTAAIVMANASGVNTGLFTRRAQQIVGRAVMGARDTTKTTQAADPSFAAYVGTYSEAPWGGETTVLVWQGKLAAVYLPTDDPLDAMMKLEKVGEHTFRRVRDDDSLGEEVRFEMGPDGRAVRMWQHNNFSPRVR